MASVDTGRRIDGTVPVYGWRHLPGVPPVVVAGPCDSPPEHRPLPHAHDFLLIGFVVRGGGAVRLDGRAWALRAGDLFLVGPGQVVDVSDVSPRFFRSTSAPGPAGPTQYTIFHDVDGSGAILANDFSLVKARFFDNLPLAPAGTPLRTASITSLVFRGAY